MVVLDYKYMPCITPITLNKDDTKAVRGYRTQIVPCGKCPECKKRKQLEWIFRLKVQLKHSKNAFFTTLTYENPPESFNGYKTFDSSDHQKFIKRLRKHAQSQNLASKNFKYYSVSEYGTKTERPHFHQILFNLPEELSNKDLFAAIWGKGLVDIQIANHNAIAYVTGYLLNKVHLRETTDVPKDEDDRLPEKAWMSKGLGKDFLSERVIEFYNKKRLPFIFEEGGKKTTIPRYYKDKIFNDLERKIVALNAQRYALQNSPKWQSFQHELDYIINKIEQHERKIKLEKTKL